MKSYLFLLIVTISFSTGCHQQEYLKAKIFERRELGGHRIMIRYQYVVDNKVYSDSATMGDNVIINTDSISVIIDPANPKKSIPDIRK